MAEHRSDPISTRQRCEPRLVPWQRGALQHRQRGRQFFGVADGHVPAVIQPAPRDVHRAGLTAVVLETAQQGGLAAAGGAPQGRVARAAGFPQAWTWRRWGGPAATAPGGGVAAQAPRPPALGTAYVAVVVTAKLFHPF